MAKEKEKDKEPKDFAQSIIYKHFLDKRKLFLWGAIDEEIAKKVTYELMYLDSVDPGKEIKFFINTPGGSVTAGMSIYDTMLLIESPITVIVTGMAASMGSILLSAPKKGRRFLYPNARVLIHQPHIMGRMEGYAVDINIQAQEMEKQRDELNNILSKASGQPLSKIRKDTDRDFYMNAKEAIDYGLADTIITKI